MVLRTERLLLRPFEEHDATRLARLAGTRRVADTTVSIPHPYSPEQALADIRRFRDEFESGFSAHFAMAAAEQRDDFFGDVLLKLIDRVHEMAELGFWIDEGEGGKGYVTEASVAALFYAFDTLKLNKVCAHSMVRNPASARVLARLGFRYEGCLRQRVRKWGLFEDVDAWGLLREEWRLP